MLGFKKIIFSYHLLADPASQFRFQSEKDWDQETDGEPTQVSQKLIYHRNSAMFNVGFGK